MVLDPSTLRLLWTAVQDMSNQDLLTLSDTALAATLLQQISRKVLLNGEEVCQMYAYVGSKLPLIRDVADSCQCDRLRQQQSSRLKQAVNY